MSQLVTLPWATIDEILSDKIGLVLLSKFLEEKYNDNMTITFISKCGDLADEKEESARMKITAEIYLNYIRNNSVRMGINTQTKAAIDEKLLLGLCSSLLSPMDENILDDIIQVFLSARKEVVEKLERSTYHSFLQYLGLEDDSSAYCRRHKFRGVCIIINEKTYQEHTNLKINEVTDADTRLLFISFSRLGFTPYVIGDLKGREILSYLEGVSKKEYHLYNDCFVVCILGYGDDDYIVGVDGDKVKKDEIFHLFNNENCPHLMEKPKMFFIQAYSNQDDPISSDQDIIPMPRKQIGPDFFICHSKIRGGNQRNSWFIKTLTEVLGVESRKSDVFEMTTVMNHLLSIRCPDEVPLQITSTLKKKIFLHPKFKSSTEK